MNAPVNAGTRQRKAPLRGAGYANAHTDTAAPGDRWVGRVDVGVRRESGFTGLITGRKIPAFTATLHLF